MEALPLISVLCLPGHIAGSSRPTIDGILLQQTDFPVEVLIPDDLSTDDMFAEQGTPDPRFHGVSIIPFPFSAKSASPAVVLNFMLAKARGRYVALCHTGDCWTDPDKLQRQADFLDQNSGYSYTLHAFTPAEISGSTEEIDHVFAGEDADVGPLESGTLPIHTSTICFRNLFATLPPEAMQTTDTALFLSVMLGLFGKGRYLSAITHNLHLTAPADADTGSRDTIGSAAGIRNAYAIFRHLDRIGKYEAAEKWLKAANVSLTKLTTETEWKTLAAKITGIPLLRSEDGLRIDLTTGISGRSVYDAGSRMDIPGEGIGAGDRKQASVPENELFSGICRNNLAAADLLIEYPAGCMPLPFKGKVVHSEKAIEELLHDAARMPKQVAAYITEPDKEAMAAAASAADHFPDTRFLIALDQCSFQTHGNSLPEFHALLTSKGYRVFLAEEGSGTLTLITDMGNLIRKFRGRPVFSLRLFAVRKEQGLHLVYFAHEPLLSGANLCLLDLVTGLAKKGMVVNVVVPGRNILSDKLQRNGIGTVIIDSKNVMEIAWRWTMAGNETDDLDTGMTNAGYFVMNFLLPRLRSLQPDIICSQTVTIPWGAVCARMLDIPHTASIREYGDLDHGLSFRPGVRACMDALYHDSDIVFCVTRDVARHLFGDDPQRKVEVIYSYLPIELPSEPSEDAGRERHHVQPEAPLIPRIGLLATYTKNKGQEDLVRAVIQLMKDGFPVRCIMAGWIGDTEYYAYLKEIADTSGFASSFEFMAHTENPYLLMQEIDAVISCSKIEGLGRTLIEAIQLGKPIIHADSGGPAEIFTHGEHALSYRHGDWQQLADRIRTTLTDKSGAEKRMKASGKHVADQFNEERYAGRVWESMQRACKEKKDRKHSEVLKLLQAEYHLSTATDHISPVLYYSSIRNEFQDAVNKRSGPIPFGPFAIDHSFTGEGIRFFSLLLTLRHPIELIIHRFITDDGPDDAESTDPIDHWVNAKSTGHFSWKFLTMSPAFVFEMPFAVNRLRIEGTIRQMHKIEVMEELSEDLQLSIRSGLEMQQGHRQELITLEQVIAGKSSIIEHLEKTVGEQTLANDQLKNSNTEQAYRIGELEWRLGKREQEVIDRNRKIDAMRGTYAWKLSAPLRRLETFLKKLLRSKSHGLSK